MKNKLLIMILLMSILITTIVYAVFSTQLNIEGEAIVRSEQDIRITNISISNTTNGAYETYNNKYNKDTTFMYVTLPANSNITYEIEITNKNNIGYDISKIQQLNNTNQNNDISISLNVGDIVNSNSTNTFTITLTNNTSEEQQETLIYQYEFVEHINSYVVNTYSTPNSYTFTVPYTGIYKIELWGASGGIDDASIIQPSTGGFTSGNIKLNLGERLYVFVGGNDAVPNESYTFNGGGRGEATGGGATDIRLINGKWNNFNSLKSRIMVAGGGGGGFHKNTTSNHKPGYAGGLVAYDADADYYKSALSPVLEKGYSGHGGTQTEGGSTGIIGCHVSGWTCDFTNANGIFGLGGYGIIDSNHHSSGGGSGYYGGGHGIHLGDSWSGGGGGSSFISGHDGCDAIDKDSTSDNIIHTGQSVHYSGYEFTDTVMIDGTGCKWTNELTTECNGMPTHDGTSTMMGNTGNGYAKITFIERVFE